MESYRKRRGWTRYSNYRPELSWQSASTRFSKINCGWQAGIWIFNSYQSRRKFADVVPQWRIKHQTWMDNKTFETTCVWKKRLALKIFDYIFAIKFIFISIIFFNAKKIKSKILSQSKIIPKKSKDCPEAIVSWHLCAGPQFSSNLKTVSMKM